MPTPRPPRLDRLEFGRPAAVGGALAGLCGAFAALLILGCRAVLHDLPAEAALGARAALVGSDRAWVGLAIQLAAPTAFGALFGWRTGVRSGLEQALRGVVVAMVLWAAGRALLPWATSSLWHGPLAPTLPEYLLYGALLGLQSRFSRQLLHKRWRSRPATRVDVRAWSTSRRPVRSP